MLEVTTIKETEKWQQIIGNSAEIYEMWQYVSAFYKNGDGEPLLISQKCNEGLIYVVIMKRDIAIDCKFKNILPINKYFDIITPYGYGGVIIVGKVKKIELNEFFENFKQYCSKNNIISEFIRLNPLLNNYENYKYQDYEIINNSKTVYIKLESEEQIWNDLKSTCRNRIRKAKSNGLVVKSGFDNKMLNEFKEIYFETMSRDNAIDYYYFNDKFYKDIEQNLNGNAKFYTAYLNDKAIDSILVIYSGSNAHYHLGGTLNEYMNIGAHNLTIYEAAVDCMKLGYKKFHLGGGYGGDDSPLLRFKSNFSREELLDFYIGKKIYNRQVYDKLIKIREDKKDLDKIGNFFPLYRS